ncbi:MAG TPA: diacylglycerol kinase family protein [Kofleriaceae bacterium]|nr:diacylglycerol kinase family protein [Kofleriaceae bacterium]
MAISGAAVVPHRACPGVRRYHAAVAGTDNDPRDPDPRPGGAAPGIVRWLHDAPAVLVANPTAHSGKAADWIRVARALLDEAHVPHRFVATEPEGRTIDRVREVIDDGGARVVIYMGGDGTFAEVAKGIFASQHAGDVAMGMLPTGTANDQGKSFGLLAGAGALERNVAVIAAGEVVGCDVGQLVIERGTKQIHRDLFFDSFSIGLGAASLSTRNRDRERVGRIPGLGALYRDQLVYAGAVLQRFVESYVVDIKFDVDAVIDGVVVSFENVLDIILKNTKIFGGEWVFDPRTESDDGRFELVPVTGRRDFGTKLIGSLRRSPVGVDDLQLLGFTHAPAISGAHFDLTIRGGTLPAAQCDGEELPAGERYRIDVVPRALRLIVPRDHVEPAI